MSKLTYERASKLLRYEPETGNIYWKVRRQGIRIGDEAGALHYNKRNTYRRIRIDGRNYRAHRVAWLLYYGVWPTGQIDHLNGNGLDNRIKNLREVTNQENQKNARMRRNNTSGRIGVSWYKRDQVWRARVKINGKDKHLGNFDDYDEACAVRRSAEVEYGFTARHGK